jgi:hypothetical protein
MSTYQYYEFRKIESSLSDEAMQTISDLSSRAQVSRTSASFTYNYGDFRSDPLEVLRQHFDALFYTANWGSRRLASSDCPMICLPKTTGRCFSRGCKPLFWSMDGPPMPSFRRYLPACGNFRRGIGR